GVAVGDVAESLYIHPFMLSLWRKQAREERIMTKGCGGRQSGGGWAETPRSSTRCCTAWHNVPGVRCDSRSTGNSQAVGSGCRYGAIHKCLLFAQDYCRKIGGVFLQLVGQVVHPNRWLRSLLLARDSTWRRKGDSRSAPEFWPHFA